MTRQVGVGVLLVLIAALVFGWAGFRETVSEDPFENALVVAVAPNFERRRVPGRVSEYISPAYFDVMPDIDWGEKSVYFETGFPLERDLYGGPGDGLTVRCAEVAFASVDDLGTLPGPVGWPPDALFAAARADPSALLQMRRCVIEIWPKDPASYDFPKLLHRCEDAIRARTLRADLVREEDDTSLLIRNASATPLPHGTLIEANCLVLHQRERLQFELWVLTGGGG